ncbi:MAG: hypothetical protein P8X60_08160 [Robiginitalea sp.]|jgi:hypothetical protein
MSTKKLVSTSDYLLPSSLEGLHMESRQWLDTVAFWKDETKFFASVLKKQQEEVPEGADFSEMLRNLDRLHEMLYDYFTDEIMEHERLLSTIEKGVEGIADNTYRDQHRQLKDKMEVFNQDFRKFKMMVFGYAKKS